MKTLLLLVIKFYQVLLSPFKGSIASCRFYPSCSHYSFQAIEKYGAKRGGILAFKRILRCNPWNPGGFDPVP
jgi:putative membrane protein insertion efficiency factor